MNKKTIYMSAIVSLLPLFAACDMMGPPVRISEHGGKAEVLVQIGGAGIAGRTVWPSVALNDVTAWELRGGKQGETETLLAEFSGAGGTTVILDAGAWSFTLAGYKGDARILTGSIPYQNISTGTNILNFTVAPVLEGEGTINIIVELPAGSGITAARVFKDGIELGSPVAPLNNNIAVEGAYPAGVYVFSVRLYKGGELYGVVSEAVYVWANLVSEKTYTLGREDLNLTFTITYHLEDGETETSHYQQTDAYLTLPVPPSREGYGFRGWYENARFSGEPVTGIPSGSQGDKDFYAKWVAGKQVPSDGYSYTLAELLGRIKSGLEGDDGVYIITLDADDEIVPTELNYGGKKVDIVLKGGTAERKVSLTSNGSLFTVGSGVTLTLGDKVTLQGKSSNSVALVTVNSGGTLEMKAGSKISGNTNSSSSGGAVYVNGGTFTMSDGEISGNTASNGGGVYVNNGTLEMKADSKISGNSSSNGGGAYMFSGTFTMNGGEISGNTVSSNGGGVYVNNGTLEMKADSKISGNSSSNGGGAYVSGGTFAMNGGEISGNTASSNGGGVYVSSNGTFAKQSGGIVYGTDHALKNTAATGGYSHGHAVYVSQNQKRNTTVEEGVALNSNVSGAAGGWEDPLPGDLPFNEILEWLDECAAEGGAYTITLSGDETVEPKTLSYSGKTVRITLSGGAAERTISLSSNGSLFTVGSGITLTLDNNITLLGRSSNTATLVTVSSGGTLEMKAGSKISGNTYSSSNGGGVYVNGGTFTMSGGEISGNTASYGGGVYVSGGTFTVSGGKMSGNTASSNGGGVYVSGGTFTMSDGVISGNTASSSGGGVYVSGNGKFIKQSGGIIHGADSVTLKNTASNYLYGYAVYVSQSQKRNTTVGAGVTLDSTASGAAGGWKELLPGNLSLDESLEWLKASAETGDTYTITLSRDETVVPTTLSYSGKTVQVTLSGGAAERTISLSSNGSLFTVGSGVTLTLDNNITLLGRSSNTATLVTVNSGGALEMKAVSKISGNTYSSSNGGGVYVNGGRFTMSGGEISGNTASSGGGVYVSGGTFTMSGGTINGNIASSNGGGVYVSGSNGTFTMSGGVISGNTTSSKGGGVYVNSGTFTKQQGGVIYGSNEGSALKNTAGGDGRAVYVYTGGKIRDRTAGEGVVLDGRQSGSAGGWEILFSNLSLVQSLERISDNMKLEEEGVYTIELSSDETIGSQILLYSNKNVNITIRGGSTERTLTLNSNGALFTVENGVTLTLENNITLQGRSSNMTPLTRVNSGGTLIMNTGSKISGNTNTAASSKGGGVLVNSNGTFIMNGGEISGNTASSGGGVYVDSSGTFTKQSGGTIYGPDDNAVLKNTATNGDGYGHAVYVDGSPAKKRNTTAGVGVTLDSGSAGGWE